MYYQHVGVPQTFSRTCRYVRTLKGVCKLAILSNAVASYFHTITTDLALSTLFDVVAISSDIGHAKPEQEAYEYVLKALGTSPDQALFIDDNPTNVQAAETIGMVACRYETNKQVRSAVQMHVQNCG